MRKIALSQPVRTTFIVNRGLMPNREMLPPGLVGLTIRKRIGWNIKRLRAEREITQEDFATDRGFDRGYISGVERGVRNPSATVIGRIATALGVDAAELFDEAKARAFAKTYRR